MKKLFIVIVLLVMVGCSTDYSEIKPETVGEGVELSIDSTKWTPVLVQIKGNEIKIYESGEIREVRLWDSMDTFLIGYLVGVFMVLIIIIVTSRD